jgi:hypothetical protein
MSIKIKFPQKELKRRIAHLLNIHPSKVLFVTATMGGKSFIASIKSDTYWGTSKEETKTFTIWEVVNCLPLDDIESDFTIKDLIFELREYLSLMGLTEYPKDIKILKQAYRQKAKESHPDHGGNPEMFRLVKTAYEKLKAHHGTFFAQNS